MFVCAGHRRPGDVDIEPAQPYRRLRVSVVVDLAATAWNPSIAQNHAVVELCDALAPLGAVVNVIGVTSTIVQPGAPAAAPEPSPAAVGV